MEKSGKVYSKWRRAEAYQVPMTVEGGEKAHQRYRGFCDGFDSGMEHAMLMLEKLHSKNKKTHSFFLLAKEAIKEEQLKLRKGEE